MRKNSLVLYTAIHRNGDHCTFRPTLPKTGRTEEKKFVIIINSAQNSGRTSDISEHFCCLSDHGEERSDKMSNFRNAAVDMP